METTMIDSNLLFWIEVCALTVLVGVGIWRFWLNQQSATIKVSDSMAYDMRQDGQRSSVQVNSVVTPISAI
jgi:hypothetical protein